MTNRDAFEVTCHCGEEITYELTAHGWYTIARTDSTDPGNWSPEEGESPEWDGPETCPECHARMDEGVILDAAWKHQDRVADEEWGEAAIDRYEDGGRWR